MWRERDGWKGPYRLLAVNGETCTIQIPYGPTNFRSTVVKPYYTEHTDNSNDNGSGNGNDIDNDIDNNDKYTPTNSPDLTITVAPPLKKRGRSRPRGSKNKRYVAEQFLTAKEKGDLELSYTLRHSGVITEPGPPF